MEVGQSVLKNFDKEWWTQGGKWRILYGRVQGEWVGDGWWVVRVRRDAKGLVKGFVCKKGRGVRWNGGNAG